MKRKVIQQGAATLMISLPAKWCRANDVQKGSELEITPNKKDLIVSTSETAKEKQIEIQLQTDSFTTNRAIIMNLYRLGYSKIAVNYPTKEIGSQLETITANTTPGLFVMESSKKRALLCSLSKTTIPSIKSIFLKMVHNINWLFKILIDNETGDPESIEKQIRQFDNIVRKEIMSTQNELAPLWWSFFTDVARGQRELYRLFQFNLKVNKKEIELLRSCQKTFSHLVSLYQKVDFSAAALIHKQHIITTRINLHTENARHIKNADQNFHLASSSLIGILSHRNSNT